MDDMMIMMGVSVHSPKFGYTGFGDGRAAL
jgi:hypothetical protein